LGGKRPGVLFERIDQRDFTRKGIAGKGFFQFIKYPTLSSRTAAEKGYTLAGNTGLFQKGFHGGGRRARPDGSADNQQVVGRPVKGVGFQGGYLFSHNLASASYILCQSFPLFSVFQTQLKHIPAAQRVNLFCHERAVTLIREINYSCFHFYHSINSSYSGQSLSRGNRSKLKRG
jgi:hypothetical protein